MCSAQDFVELSCTPPELREIANNAIQKLLPTKSKPKYEKEYQKFCTWCDENNVNNLTENIVLAYFEAMSKTKKSSTMWSSYSMLRTCLSIYKNIDISKYLKVIAYLKRQSENYQPKKSSILQSEDIIKFISDADDYTFLAMKVILIIGYCGACRRDELTHMTLNNIEFKSNRIEVSVFATKNNISRVFLITEVSWIALIKKYVELRPPHTSHDRLFLTYRKGRCTVSPIGINKIGEVPKNIAKFLKLSNYQTYTGHCFRRSSASHLANQGGDLLTIKKHGGWKSSAVAEGYVESSLQKKSTVAHMLSNQSVASTSTAVSESVLPIQNVQNLTSNSSNPSTEKRIGADSAIIVNENILTEQQVPPISILASDSASVTVKIYQNCTINNN